MNQQDHPTRREFARGVGLAAGVVAVGQLPTLEAAGPAARPRPDEVLAQLLEGNRRFVEGKLKNPGRAPKDFLPLDAGQAPPTVVLGCADSRVAPEILFDQGVGDLFVVRGAGNMVGSGPILKGSIEYAVEVLGARLIIVLGHTRCGACSAAIKFIEDRQSLPGAIEGLVDYIRPSVRQVAGQPGDKLTNVTKANVLAGVKRLSAAGPILAKYVKSGEMKVVGAMYDLATGKVELVG